MTCFFDTNILVYAIDGRFPDKQKTALALFKQTVTERNFVISTQVLVEFFNATTKGKHPLLHRLDAQTQMNALASQRVITTTPAMVVSAGEYALRYKLQWFDALMVDAAISVGATTLYSEDMHHGQRFGALTLVNPFLG